MDISEISRSGILNKGEELADGFKATYRERKKRHHGLIAFTDKRFLFLQKPSGRRARGLNVKLSCAWGAVMSVSTAGLVRKRLNVSMRIENRIEIAVFSCDSVETAAQKIVATRDRYVEEMVVEAKRVIIEEASRDKASEILQKRLARGEITLEEFHDRIQRL